MVYVILVNYNNSNDTIACLSSLMSAVDSFVHIIVVDNYSSTEQIGLLKTYTSQFFEIELIENHINYGFASGCNIALKEIIKKGLYDYIWLLNNDTEITSCTLDNMIKQCESNPDIGVCGSKILDYCNRTTLQSMGGQLNRFFATTSHIQNTDNNREPDYIVGASMLITRSCLEQVGLMSDDYFLYYEDVDYSLRAREHGFMLAVSKNSIVYHKEGGATIPSGQKSEFIDLLQIQNRKVFAKKFGLSLFGVYCGILLAAMNRLRRGQFLRMIKVALLVVRDFNWKQ